MAAITILLVESDRRRRGLCRQALSAQPYAITVVRSVAKALRLRLMGPPDLVVLNAASMKTSGVRMCRTLRKTFSSARILLISSGKFAQSPDGTVDAILAPPFTARKLLNRVRQLLPLTGGSWLEAGPIRLNVEHRRAVCNGHEVHLTAMQTRLLEEFLRNPDQLLTREHLMQQVWETRYVGDTRTLDVHMSWLRRALEPDPQQPRYFRTSRGQGYLLATVDQGSER